MWRLPEMVESNGERHVRGAAASTSSSSSTVTEPLLFRRFSMHMSISDPCPLGISQ
jgi:hypothetical protein